MTALAGLVPSPSLAQALVAIGSDADRAMIGTGAVEVTVTSSGDSVNDGMRLPFAEVREGDRKVATMTDENGASESPVASVRIVELDNTNETPEVVFNSFSGGAHCCAGGKVALKGPSGSWRQVDIGNFDGAGDFVEDVDGDGRSEFVTVDDAFLYAFDAYASSFAPLKILAVERGELKDVTREERFQATPPDLARGAVEGRARSVVRGQRRIPGGPPRHAPAPRRGPCRAG